MRIANLLPLFTLSLAACAVGVDDDAEGQEAVLIASVDRPSGSHVEFLTTGGGGVLVTESWQMENHPTLSPDVVRTVDPRDYYLALTGEEAPDDLAAAVEASDIPYRRLAPSELVLGDGPRPTSFWQVTAAEFKAALCYEDGDYGPTMQEWCHVDQTGEIKHRKDDINGLSASVCTVSGEVEFRFSLREWGTWDRNSYMVKAGECEQAWYGSQRDFDGESWVMQVESGDKYHHGGMRCWGTWPAGCIVYHGTLPH
jgi:hypothetical protein